MIAIDLANGVTETIDPETWSNINGTEAVRSMVSTVDPEVLAQYRGIGTMSLRTLASMSNPYHMSDNLRERLSRLAPAYLAQVDEWAEEDRLIR